MHDRYIKITLIAFATLLTSGTAAQAGPILDFLFPNRALRRSQAEAAQVTYRVPVGNYPNSGGNTYSYPGNYPYNTVGYSPTTSYRSVWTPVPVTRYRPVGYVNPLSTGTQTNMLPCSTEEWQVRRVPYLTYQPSSLFGGGSGWQTAPPYGTTTVGYRGAATSYPTSPWTPVTPTQVTTGYRAAPIDNGWTTVGSGVSYAAPAASSTTYYGSGSVPAAVSPAGYRNAADFAPTTVTPLPSEFESGQSSWRPVSEETASGGTHSWQDVTEEDDICQNGPTDYATSGRAATPWQPVEPNGPSSNGPSSIGPSSSRTQVTPADRSPVLPPETGSTEGYDPSANGDPYRSGRSYANDNGSRVGMTPVRRPTEQNAQQLRSQQQSRGALAGYTEPIRPSLTRGSFRVPPETAPAAYEQHLPRRSTSPADYPHPIPDLQQQRLQHSGSGQRPATPIPSLLDDDDERTARRRQVTPERRAVPINWNAGVDIDRSGGLTRVSEGNLHDKSESSSHSAQRPLLRLAPPDLEQEGGWRRAR